MGNNKKIILFNGHDFRFLHPIINYYSNHPDYEILMDEHPGHVIENIQKSKELLNKADIIFCEWCLGNAEWYSQNKKENQILIIRLHSQELGLSYLERILWINVDKIIFICPNNLNIFIKRFPELKNKVLMIYNPIDTKKFDNPKLEHSIFNVGFVGLSPKLKAPNMAFDIFRQLRYIDSRYKMYMKGKMPWEYDWLWKRKEEREYYEKFFYKIDNFLKNGDIVVESYDNDIAGWFSKIGFILSTSDREGSHQVVAEGMASGSLPVIRNWDGANLIYPNKYIFKSTNEAVFLISKWIKEESYDIEISSIKNFSFQNFDQSIIIESYEKLLCELLEREKLKQSSNPVSTPKNPDEKNKMKNKLLKVLMVCYINPGSRDGYVTRVLEEARVLRKNRIKVILLCFFNNEYLSKVNLIKEHLDFLLENSGAFVHLRPCVDFFNLNYLFGESGKIENEILDLAKFYDVNIIHGESIYPSIYSSKVCKKLDTKLIFDVHGIAPEESEMNGEGSARINALKKAEEQIINSSKVNVFVSNEMKKHFQKKYNRSFENSIIIPTCVDTQNFYMGFENRQKMRKKLGINERFVFLYLGALNVWQWPEAMFNLFGQIHKMISNSYFYLLVPKAYHQKLVEMIKDRGISEENYTIDQVDQDKVGSIISIADTGFLLREEHPVNQVAYPTKAGEYLAAGIPIITTKNVGDVSKEIQNKNLGLIISPSDEGVSPKEVAEIKKFIIDVSDNREKWFLKCRKFAQKNLDWNLYGDILKKAYYDLTLEDKKL
ncbi:MAG: hypothetical protein CVU41_01015 [Chloroflexi bacterium HGW-Chloroflexi-3]|nr:MAG: hypothetical protein CVU41_01015 [Chloroflexi bacterium HGW-Chloroflexi-3]